MGEFWIYLGFISKILVLSIEHLILFLANAKMLFAVKM